MKYIHFNHYMLVYEEIIEIEMVSPCIDNSWQINAP